MNNHHHVVLHINKAKSLHWSEHEVCERWNKLYKGSPLTQEFERSEASDTAKTQAVKIKLDQWRLDLPD